MPNGSGIPLWVQQFLHGSKIGDWLEARPEFYEASYAAAKSLSMGVATISSTVMGVAVAGGHANSSGDCIHFVFNGGGLWGAFIGFVVASGWAKVRFTQAGYKAAASAAKGTP